MTRMIQNRLTMISANITCLKGTRVLIVDDDPLMRAMLAKLVSPHVAEVLLATDGQDGLEKWRSHQPDVVVTDITMPRMNGLAMSEAIKAQDPGSTIIVISASSENEYLRQAIDIGIERYVFKPVDSKLLLDAIAKCARHRTHLLELEMAKMVFEVGNEGILVTDAEPRILTCNPAFSAISGYRPDEVIGQKTSIFSSGLHDAEFYRNMWDALKTHRRWSGEITNRRKNGETCAQWMSIAAVEGKLGDVKRYVAIVSDITKRKKQEEYIRHLAHFDSLTGLANRVLFNDRLQHSIASARRNGGRLAVLYLDLDYFKAVNDKYGHTVGDEVLKVVAARMQNTVRQGDLVSRRGGDEFILLFEEVQQTEHVAGVCRKLIEHIAQPIVVAEEAITVGASIGISLFPDDAEDAEMLLTTADFALYEAKANGRGCFQYCRVETQTKAWMRLDMERELRDGLKDWRFEIHYLPEISLVTGELENIEALLRFQHPIHGLIDAGRFLEIAEEIGIMPEVGRRALAIAAAELPVLSDLSHRNLGLVVDLSCRQLSAPEAVDGLLSILAEAGVHNGNITFECAESALVGHGAALQSLFKLAAAGCKFTLDDFGAGYCSFDLLGQLPMTSIKIDRSFVSEIDTSPQSRELVAALIAFSKRLGLRTVAEGVENLTQLQFLRENDCDSVQGYLFGKPMDKSTLQAFLTEQTWRNLLAAEVNSPL